MTNLTIIRPTHTQQRVPANLTVDVTDPHLQKGLKDCASLEEQQDWIEDMAEIGARVTEHQSRDEQSSEILKILDRQRRLEREQHEAQLREQERAHQTQLAAVEEQRRSERLESNQRLEALAQTVNSMNAVLSESALQSQDAVRQMQMESSNLMERVGEQLLDAVRNSNIGSDELLRVVQSTVESATGDLREHFENAALLLQNFQEREESRRLAEELRESASSRKGMLFEERLFQELSDFADNRGDLVERTGTLSEDGTNSKKGDLLYTLQTRRGPVRIAIEAKDKHLTQSGKQPYFLPDLRASKRERRADYGIVAASLDENSREDGRANFQPLKPLGNNNFAVLVDEDQSTPIALLAAIQMIGTLELERRGDGADSGKLDEVQRRLQNIQEISGNLRTLKRDASNLQTNLDNMNDTLLQFDRNLKREVKALGSLFENAA